MAKSLLNPEAFLKVIFKKEKDEVLEVVRIALNEAFENIDPEADDFNARTWCLKIKFDRVLTKTVGRYLIYELRKVGWIATDLSKETNVSVLCIRFSNCDIASY